MSSKTLLVMAGGTGGHVMPALAVANQLRDRGHRIIWLGTQAGIESRLVPAAGFDLRTIAVKGLRGTGWKRKMLLPWMLLTTAFQALKVVSGSKADALLGMGGFASGPGAVMGRLLGKPLVIHEQNALAGLTNRLVARLANRVLSGFQQADGLPSAEWVGNPVKAEIAAISPPAERLADRSAALSVLVVGGSQGAQVFNEYAPSVFAAMQTTPVIRHQAGKDKAAATQAQYADAGVSAEVSEFIDDMAAAYRWADVVLCRAGAMTVAELAAAGAAAIMVPFPHAVGDHQTANAQALVKADAGYCLAQPEFEAGKAVALLDQLSADRARLMQLANNARAQAKPDAAKVVADICEGLMEGRDA